MEQVHSKAYNCDCLEYMRSLPDNYFDLAIADPPYGIGASRPSKKAERARQADGSVLQVPVTDFGKKDWDDIIPSQEFFDELRRVSKNQIIWGANYFGLQGGMIVWDKINGNSDQYDCEIAYQSFNKRTDLVHYMWNGMFQGKYCGRDIRQAAVQQGNKALNEKRIHPTQKPVILYEWLLNNYAKKGDRIFDPMMGSQSSRIAAHRLGFDYVGCELDKEYYEKGCARFDTIRSHQKELSDAKDNLMSSLDSARADLGDTILINPTDIKLAGINHTVRAVFLAPDGKGGGEYRLAGQDYAVLAVGEGGGHTEFNTEKILDDTKSITVLAAAIREAHVYQLKLNAKMAIYNRIVMPSARSFTPEQVDTLTRYRAMFTTDTDTKELFTRLYEDVIKDPEVARKPEKWQTDTLKELNDLAKGITRDEVQGLRI